MTTETVKTVSDSIIREDIQFIKNTKVSFIIETKVQRRQTETEEEQIHVYKEGAINQIIKKRYIQLPEENRRLRVVCLGICLGVTNFKNGKTKKLVGLGYSK